MTPEISIRPFTNDQFVLDKVLYSNVYRLKPKSEGVVIDIGAHCGYFSFAALSYGYKKVYAFEPFIENYKLLLRNTAAMDDDLIATHQLGVYPRATNMGFVYPQREGSSLDCSNIGVDQKGKKSYTNACITLDEILMEYVTEPEVSLLKINLGYAEDSVLFSSNVLASKVKNICGEVTLENQGEMDVFTDTMIKKGFPDSRLAKTPEAENRFVFLLSREKCEDNFMLETITKA